MYKVILSLIVILCSMCASANNASYITVSNQVARTTELGVVANNVANVSTPGYEMDGTIFSPINKKATRRKDNSFVYTDGAYSAEGPGPLKQTGNPLDVAIAGDGYFKILTPGGPRYTLDGAMIVSSNNVLVNVHGMPFASIDNQPMLLPEQYASVEISKDGTIYVDGEEIDTIGAFTFPNKFALVKEGNNVYYSKVGDILVNEQKIMSGFLRGSNVNSAKAMTELIELERAVATTNSLMSDINNLERSTISRMTNVK